MSEAAITRRLKQVDRLRTLCLSLKKAKKESDEKKKLKSEIRKNTNDITSRKA